MLFANGVKILANAVNNSDQIKGIQIDRKHTKSLIMLMTQFPASRGRFSFAFAGLTSMGKETSAMG